MNPLFGPPGWILAVAVLILSAGCDSPEAERSAGGSSMAGHDMAAMVDTAGLQALPVPTELARGRDLFTARCAPCHGEFALGSATGPPLVHIVYEPSHHGDMAFVLAAERGVRAHHWNFGDMPPVPDVSREEVTEIIAYVRWLQREAGIR